MGSDDLFKKKRLAKKNKELSRKLPNKKPLKKILIVCEGSKTEPNYFEELRDYYKLNTTSVIDVTGDCGSSPLSVYKHAKAIQSQENQKGSPYDMVFCVIDKDAHTDYYAALEAIRKSKPSNQWVAINSVPCFEYWLLLHHKYTTKAFEATAGSSSGNKVLIELKKYFNGYEKGSKGTFLESLNVLPERDLNVVIKKAEMCLQHSKDTETDNPTTYVHILVKELLDLKKQVEMNKSK